jgi:two-component system, chemotaxis family, protein-glutamate methylesterase/glutaminase
MAYAPPEHAVLDLTSPDYSENNSSRQLIKGIAKPTPREHSGEAQDMHDTSARDPVATHDIVVIGASAGGVEAISSVVSQFPRDLRAAVLVVLHLSRGRSVLPEILTRAGRLAAVHPDDGDPLEYGRIYVARPDHHLTLEPGKVRVVHGPTENGCRPAIDPLFRSAARAYGPRVIGVVLTGALDDGTAGLAAVKEAGGMAIVQDPDEAFASSMPRSARAFVAVDHVLPLKEIGVLITSLTREQTGPMPSTVGPHVVAMEPDLGPPSIALEEGDRPGKVSIFTCPECHGTLWEADERGIVRYRCRVGHIYSAESMLAAQTDSVDRALWTALRSMEERASLTHRLAERARARKHHWVARAFDERASVADGHAAVIRELLATRALHEVPETESDVPEEVEN